jgi:hypothetical protein
VPRYLALLGLEVQSIFVLYIHFSDSLSAVLHTHHHKYDCTEISKDDVESQGGGYSDPTCTDRAFARVPALEVPHSHDHSCTRSTMRAVGLPNHRDRDKSMFWKIDNRFVTETIQS